MSKVKIYGWDNSPGAHWHVGCAIAEDGTIVASHYSSSHVWCRNDIEHMHRPEYAAKYGDGFEFIWLESPTMDLRWLAAIERNKQQSEAAKSVPEASQ